MDTYEHRYPLEYSKGNQGHLLDNWIIEKCQYFLTDEVDSLTRSIMNSKNLRRTDFYAMLGGITFKLDGEGFALDDEGNPMFEKSTEPWPLYVAVNRLTGEVLEKADYLQLTPEEANAYQIVPYIHTFDQEKNPVARIYGDDRVLIEHNITEDIFDGFLYSKCYTAMLASSTEDAIIHQHRDFIEAKIAKRDNGLKEIGRSIARGLYRTIFGEDPEEYDENDESEEDEDGERESPDDEPSEEE